MRQNLITNQLSDFTMKKNLTKFNKHNRLIMSILFALCVTSCAIYTTMNSNYWIEYELAPSKIMRNGDVFFEGKLSDGSKFSVFFDNDVYDDAEFYQVMLWQDFGWTLKNDNTWTAPSGSRTRKHGHIYVNPNRRVAVYFFPDRTFSAYKVEISK